MVEIALDELIALSKPIPRYTSYPTAPEWGPLGEEEVLERVQSLAQSGSPLSLYIHVPFCRSMCLYCGCSVILNRKKENEEHYVDGLIREMRLLAGHYAAPPRLVQLHFGGGTPTQLDCAQFDRLMGEMRRLFAFDPEAELAMEIDPRTVSSDGGEKLIHLRRLGFNRVSFGVQDTNQTVQEAVKRRQSLEMTVETYAHARELGFGGINVDLIYGLPYQTVDTFRETVAHVIAMGPDRIALFSYAKVPWLKPHQKALRESTLPSTEEKFRIYLMAREAFTAAGYTAIGMDHFARAGDSLARAYRGKSLHRNFQGYTTLPTESLVAFGVTGIGAFEEAFFQNVKELEAYYASIDRGALPIFRGKLLTEEDRLRRWVIQSLMCHFEIDRNRFSERWGRGFDAHFAEVRPEIETAIAQGLLCDDGERLAATAKGELFLRNSASIFDAYLQRNAREGKEGKFSSAV